MKAPKAKAKASPKAVAAGLQRREERSKQTKKEKAAMTRKPAYKEREMTEQYEEEVQAPPAEPVETPTEQPAVEPGTTPAEPPEPVKVKVGKDGEEMEQAVDPTQFGNLTDVTALLGIGGQSITSIVTYRYGTIEVTDILCGGSHYFIKGRQGLQEVGGTADWGTGSAVGGR